MAGGSVPEEVMAGENLQIPTIDMKKLMVDDAEEMGKLHLACTEWGFFQLINHGVTEELIEKMKEDSQEFFRLPPEEKNAYTRAPNNFEGYGHACIFGQARKLDWGHIFVLVSQPLSERNLSFWPENPPSFRTTIDKYSWELQKVSSCLLESMAKNLGIHPKQIMDAFENGRQTVRVNHFPAAACVNGSNNNVMGFTPHTDPSGLTLLLEVNEVQALQMKKNGEWMSISPKPDAFIINIGDIMEIMSNGKYKSVEHRTMLNPEKERFTIAAFQSPNATALVGPLEELVEENGALYKTLGTDEFFGLLKEGKVNSKGILYDMKSGN